MGHEFVACLGTRGLFNYTSNSNVKKNGSKCEEVNFSLGPYNPSHFKKIDRVENLLLFQAMSGCALEGVLCVEPIVRNAVMSLLRVGATNPTDTSKPVVKVSKLFVRSLLARYSLVLPYCFVVLRFMERIRLFHPIH